MQITHCLLIALVMSIAAQSLAGDMTEEAATVQAELDADCETARQKKLVAARVKLVSECVRTKEYPDSKSCEQAYESFGERAGNRPPLFYDLPACVKAYEHQTSYRSSGN